ncbi:MAG: hypothetical protein EZS26_001689 [Candidatus Ordinivivax streblomastigis]|uniref:Uncharacterized protein n=1 Tax=Candidatus Ordinivivax streblomastigis TaxID=2540710 RepID=A0A5M8P116_9BACT|nr:MAG: hypothetical protein EZS26_001689 [Candidatus Ordinivivax streblomastigis]
MIRLNNGVEVMPIEYFLKKLWSGEFITSLILQVSYRTGNLFVKGSFVGCQPIFVSHWTVF